MSDQASAAQLKRMHDASVSVIDDALGFIARELGEESVARFWRECFRPRVSDRAALGLSPRQHVERFAQDHAGHGSACEIIEEPDRFVLKLDPCGSGGALRRTKQNVNVTRKPHDWSWGKAGVPYYCTHCRIAWELIAAEVGGQAVRIHQWPDNPNHPCLNIVPKEPWPKPVR